MRNRSFITLAAGVAVTLLTTAAVALAMHPIGAPAFSFSVSPSTADAVVDSSAALRVTDTDNPPVDWRLHLDPGHRVAYADDLISPVQPAPGNGDTVGALKVLADPAADGCGNAIVQSAELVWVEPIGPGAPKGTVAEFGFKTDNMTFVSQRLFVVKSSGDKWRRAGHHDLVVPRVYAPALCHGSAFEISELTYGYARTLYPTFAAVIVQRNPKTAGTKVVYLDYLTRSGARVSLKTSYVVTP